MINTIPKNKKNMTKDVILDANRTIVNEYFRLIGQKNIKALLDLFSDDAVLYEPFSKLAGLHGKSDIENFLRVAGMANAGLNKTISFESESTDNIVAIVMFERGNSVIGRFTFRFQSLDQPFKKKIQSLHIEFL